MNFTTKILDNYIQGDFTGRYNRELVNEYVTMIVNYCKLKNYTKLFFDFRKVEGEVTAFERYKLAEHLGTLQPGIIRIGAVVTKDQSHPTKVAETVATAQNINVKISTDESEVRDWLINEPS